MFIIKPDNPEMWADALYMLSFYKVKGELVSDGEHPSSTYMVVDAPVEVSLTKVVEDAAGLAEMAFQMNWMQRGKVCSFCKNTENAEYCGHLEFSGPINNPDFEEIFEPNEEPGVDAPFFSNPSLACDHCEWVGSDLQDIFDVYFCRAQGGHVTIIGTDDDDSPQMYGFNTMSQYINSTPMHMLNEDNAYTKAYYIVLEWMSRNQKGGTGHAKI